MTTLNPGNERAEGPGIGDECHHCLSPVRQDAPWPNSVDAPATGCSICNHAIATDGMIVLCDDCLDDAHSGLSTGYHGRRRGVDYRYPDRPPATRYPDGWHLIARANVYVERGFVIHANRGGVMWTREG